MWHRAIALLGSAFLLTACNADTLQVPDMGIRAVRPTARPHTWVCPPGYECQNATNSPIAADSIAIGTSCSPEACGLGSGSGKTVQIDVGTGYEFANYDVIPIACSGGGTTNLFAQGCWDCMQSCAGTDNCPPGSECFVVPGSPGSDCRQFSCPSGWTLIGQSGQFETLGCKRPYVPGTPYASFTTESGYPNLTWSPASGVVTGYRIYRQLEWQSEAEVWATLDASTTSYTDYSSQVSGGPQGWQPSPKWVRYHVLAYNDRGTSGYSEPPYYPYTGILPY